MAGTQNARDRQRADAEPLPDLVQRQPEHVCCIDRAITCRIPQGHLAGIPDGAPCGPSASESLDDCSKGCGDLLTTAQVRETVFAAVTEREDFREPCHLEKFAQDLAADDRDRTSESLDAVVRLDHRTEAA